MTRTPSTRTSQAIGLSATLFAAGAASAASIDAAPGFFFNTLPFSDTGTTVGALSDIGTIPANIGGYATVAGPDVFYSFFVGTGGSMTFQVGVNGATGYDPSIYLLRGGVNGTDAIIARDSAAANGAESFSTTVSPGWYYFVVDSFYSSGSQGNPNRHAGAYTLNVSGTAQLAAVPEPGSAGLLALAGAAAWRRRRTGQSA